MLQIVTTPEQCISRALQPMQEKMREGSPMSELGVIDVRVQEMTNSRKIVEIRVDCSQLDNKDVFSKSVSLFITNGH
jgi:hypothetical protein